MCYNTSMANFVIINFLVNELLFPTKPNVHKEQFELQKGRKK